MLRIPFILILAALPAAADETLDVSGLREPVEILRDPWGVAHIYAQNQHDLFFAQGFNVAHDRLFQLELWRRRATGTVAEIIGERGVDHDIGARLMMVRLDMEKELAHYHPDGKEIITAFVQGINTYIAQTESNPELLPIEFELLGLKPVRWTPEVVVSRFNGLYRNVTSEATVAAAVHAMGHKAVEDLLDLHPGNPSLEPVDGLDLAGITKEVTKPYRDMKSPIKFEGEDIVIESMRAPEEDTETEDQVAALLDAMTETISHKPGGSNNWVVSGERTLSGLPIMANDPHRGITIPSLRYWVHLNAPGWNVIGGGEPALPGVSIGHNDHGAWGLTVFYSDQEDLYVYDTNPENPNQYRYKNKWRDMEILNDTIRVQDSDPIEVELKYTQHGPVLHEDPETNKAYAVAAAWREIGGAPYLPSLRMGQARNWREFREACTYFHVPAENFVWGDIHGDIGWQATGLAPLRRNWNGILPVPGDGTYEWDGFIPIKDLPHSTNPTSGFIATANYDNIPRGYPNPLGYTWATPYRWLRLEEVLAATPRATMPDMAALQVDELSIPARILVPFITRFNSDVPRLQAALDQMSAWDYVLDKRSVPAAMFTKWLKHLEKRIKELSIPEEHRDIAPGIPLTNTINWLLTPDGRFGSNPIVNRDELLVTAFVDALEELNELLGSDTEEWHYGQETLHHSKMRHSLSSLLAEVERGSLDAPLFPRGGDGNTVNNTRGAGNQAGGASFRIIADISDWDNSLGANTPGQSGNPDSQHYTDLAQLWADGQYFPIFFSRTKIESVAESTTILKP